MTQAIEWNAPAPRQAFAAIVHAAESAAAGDVDAAHLVLVEAQVGQGTLAVAAVQAVAVAVAGPHASWWWTQLRNDAHQLADAGTDPEDVCAILEVISVCEALERGALGRLTEIVEGSRVPVTAYAAIGAQLLGSVLLFREREQGITGVFSIMRRHLGISGSA